MVSRARTMSPEALRSKSRTAGTTQPGLTQNARAAATSKCWYSTPRITSTSGHVVEAAARIPAAVAAHHAVSRAGRVAKTRDGRAMRVLDMSRGKAPGCEDQQPIPGIAHARARREQIDELVLAEDVWFEALRDRQDAARAATFVDAFAARDFGAENPGAPLRLRAGVESEDGVVVAGRDVGSDGARRREMVRDVIVRPAHVEADIGARPIVIRHWKRRRRRVRQVRRRCGPCDHRRKRQARKKEISHDGRPKQAV